MQSKSKILKNIKLLKNNKGVARYFKNTSWMMVEQVLRIISGLLVGIWVARFLGPEKFGVFSYVVAFTGIFGVIAKLGLDSIIVREIVKYPEKSNIYLSTAFWLKLAGAFCALTAIVLIQYFSEDEYNERFFSLIVGAGIIFQSLEVVEFKFQAEVKAKVPSICKIIQISLSACVKVFLIINKSDLIYFFVVVAFDSLTLAIAYYFANKMHYNSIDFIEFNISVAKTIVKDSFPVLFSTIFITVNMKIDQIIVKEILGAYEVGVYTAASN
jgi:O-antigen/teichoic acid export membrane protein